MLEIFFKQKPFIIPITLKIKPKQPLKRIFMSPGYINASIFCCALIR